jgi:hypothetical protein
MTGPRWRTPLTVLTALALCAAPAEAQFRDLIDRVKADINDLKYAEAVRRGQEIFSFMSAMTPEQVMELRQVMAAAFYPEEAEAQQRDSALAHLVALVKMDPEARNAADLRWAGLDSLLETARSQTFSVKVRHAEESILIGTDGRGFVDVIATRPARFSLRIMPAAGGPAVLHDTSAATARGRLSFRAHDGERPLLVNGQYLLVVTAVDTLSKDSVVTRHRGTATGEAPTLAPLAPFNESVLRQEYTKPPRVRTFFTGIFFAGATYAIATQARAPEPLRSDFGNDGRAMMLSGMMLAATISTIWLDKGVPDRDAIQANLRARDDHRRAMLDAEAENRRRIAAYRVTIRVAPEAQ